MRLGLSLFGNLNLEQIIRLSKEAELANFDSAWVAEGSGTDAFSACTLIAENTTKLKVGTDIISIYTRHPSVLASATATVDAVSKGRFTLGLGISHRTIVQSQLGLAYTRPLKRMEETIQIVKGIFSAKEPFNFQGEIFSISNYTLWSETFSPFIQIYVAGSGPKMIELIANLSDGSLFFLKTEDRLKEAIRAIRAKKRSVNIGLVIPCAFHSDQLVATKAAASTLAMYIIEYEVYARSISEQGFSKAVENVLLNPQNAPDFINTQMVDDLCLNGDAKKIQDEVDRLKSAGLDLLILEPCFFPREDFYETVRRTIELGRSLS